MNFPVPCIICGKELASVFGDSAAPLNQPYAATTFASSGHYGSTVFDPMVGGVFLEINICDEDLRAAAKASRVLHGKTQRTPPPPPSYELWEPYQPDESY
jgi:hypothetical protein